MNGSVSSLLDAARRALREAVLPELRSDHARAQLAAVIDILAKLERVVDWAPAIIHEECKALEATIAHVEARATGGGLVTPSAHGNGDPLSLARDRVRQLSDWVFDAVPPGELRSELDAALSSGLRAAVAAERRRIPRTDFAAMTESKES